MNFLLRCFLRFYTEFHVFVCLKYFYDLDDIFSPWITARAEHAVNAFVGFLELLGQLLERNSRIDVITKHGLPRCKVACKQFVYCLGQHLSAELRVDICAGYYCCPKLTSRRHLSSSLPCYFL